MRSRDEARPALRVSGRCPGWPSLRAGQVRRLAALAEDWTGGVGPAAEGRRRPETGPGTRTTNKKIKTANQENEITRSRKVTTKQSRKDKKHQLHQLLSMTSDVKIKKIIKKQGTKVSADTAAVRP
ncbi:hypothetical protein [Streptosporangium nondiastaticum]|uniref:hypothetical protein n=1 Tax=Streptosporangium nondiastaticum TaxID=35764 RepID=UPI0031F9FAE4